MRLKEYIELSSENKELNDFRSFKIGFTSENNNNKAKKILEIYKFDDKLIKDIEKTNKALKKNKKMDFVLGFCEDIGIEKISKIKINKKKKDSFKMKLFEFNNELSKIQRKIEKEIKEGEK